MQVYYDKSLTPIDYKLPVAFERNSGRITGGWLTLEALYDMIRRGLATEITELK